MGEQGHRPHCGGGTVSENPAEVEAAAVDPEQVPGTQFFVFGDKAWPASTYRDAIPGEVTIRYDGANTTGAFITFVFSASEAREMVARLTAAIATAEDTWESV